MLPGPDPLLTHTFAGDRAPAGRPVWSVATLLQALGETIVEQFSVCTVRGEISGFSRAGSGHCYFSLKDGGGAEAALRCAMFRRAASLLGFIPADGQSVELRGRLGIFAPRGELQFIVESMQQAGAGALLEHFLRLKARLQAEGLFDAARKRPLVEFPRRVGIVTSLGAAALHDVVSALARRSPHVAVVVYPSAVQGAGAAQSLADAIALAGQRAEVDTLLVCRGGGSLEDLWAFNDERVVRAIASSPIPVISGIGHETDTTLADYAADLRAPTPTAAAELAAPATSSCQERLGVLAALLQRRLRQILDGHAQRVDSHALRLARPGQRLQMQHRQLDRLQQRLVAARGGRVDAAAQRLGRAELRWQGSADAAMRRHAQRLAEAAARLTALDPQRVLGRGYAWLADRAGQPVLGAAGLVPGQALQAHLRDGIADLRVEQVTRSDPVHSR